MPSREQVLRERRRRSGRHTHEACPREGGEWVSSALDSRLHGNDGFRFGVTPAAWVGQLRLTRYQRKTLNHTLGAIGRRGRRALWVKADAPAFPGPHPPPLSRRLPPGEGSRTPPSRFDKNRCVIVQLFYWRNEVRHPLRARRTSYRSSRLRNLTWAGAFLFSGKEDLWQPYWQGPGHPRPQGPGLRQP